MNMEEEFRLEGFTVSFKEKGGHLSGFVKEIPECKADSSDMLTFRMELRASISEYLVSHASF
jgi:hypothetical protein